MRNEDINQILGITESFELPQKIMEILRNEKKITEIMDVFMEYNSDLTQDWFTEYFEEQHANKSKMAQDFTPKEVAQLVANISGKANVVADVCAGTGGLSIGVWNQNPNAVFVCYELSNRAIPLLLLNLAIRNMNAYVIRTDILTGEVFEKYRVTAGIKYGKVEEYEGEPPKPEIVVSNPPYSMKYKNKDDARFTDFKEFLPKNFADYVFVAYALSILQDAGKAVFILPHGVLFRGNKEKEFRKYLIEKRYIRTVIGLPDKLFINTDIPTLIMEIDTAGKSDGVFFVNAERAYEKKKAKNIIDASSSKQILDTYNKRNDIERFSKFVTYWDIKQNDYNMNIPRYVNMYIPEELPELEDVFAELGKLEKEELQIKTQFLNMLKELHGTTSEEDKKHTDAIKKYKNILVKEKQAYEQEVLKL